MICAPIASASLSASRENFSSLHGEVLFPADPFMVSGLGIADNSQVTCLGLRQGESIPFTTDLLFSSTRERFDSPALCDLHGQSRTFSFYYPKTRPGLDALVRLTEGARRTLRVIRRNVGFSLAYNVVGASLAMTGRLTPLAAAILMPASSLTVVLASWRSRTFGKES